MLLFPHNGSFIRLPLPTNRAAAGAMLLPPQIGPQADLPGAPPMPAFPVMPMPTEKLELSDMGQRTNLLGFFCARYEIKQRGEVMEIWATDQLIAYQSYARHQPSRFGPRLIEEQWPELLKGKKLFPLLAMLRFDNGAERFRFEVKSVISERISDPSGKLFQPPPDYREIDPLPF